MYEYVLVTSNQSPIMDNVSDHNRFDASRLKGAKKLLIKVKRYITTFAINGFAIKVKSHERRGQIISLGVFDFVGGWCPLDT